MYQSAGGPPNDGRSAVRVPDAMYEPAANNVYDAGVRSNANRTATAPAELQPESNSNSSV